MMITVSLDFLELVLKHLLFQGEKLLPSLLQQIAKGYF